MRATRRGQDECSHVCPLQRRKIQHTGGPQRRRQHEAAQGVRGGPADAVLDLRVRQRIS